MKIIATYIVTVIETGMTRGTYFYKLHETASGKFFFEKGPNGRLEPVGPKEAKALINEE